MSSAKDKVSGCRLVDINNNVLFTQLNKPLNPELAGNGGKPKNNRNAYNQKKKKR